MGQQPEALVRGISPTRATEWVPEPYSQPGDQVEHDLWHKRHNILVHT